MFFVFVTLLLQTQVGGSIWAAKIISSGFLGLGWAMGCKIVSLETTGAAVALVGRSIALTTAFQGHPRNFVRRSHRYSASRFASDLGAAFDFSAGDAGASAAYSSKGLAKAVGKTDHTTPFCLT